MTVTNPSTQPAKPLRVDGWREDKLLASPEKDGVVSACFALTRPFDTFEARYIEAIGHEQQGVAFDVYEEAVIVEDAKIESLGDWVNTINGLLATVEIEGALLERRWRHNRDAAVEALERIDYQA